MIAIDLYRKYLYNSTKSVGRTEKQKKLSFEEEMIGGILSGVDDLFYQDKSINDKEDISIYTYIKREIVASAWRNGESVALREGRFLLQGLLNEIKTLKEGLTA